jgi:uncharacterized protein (DUF983 family)
MLPGAGVPPAKVLMIPRIGRPVVGVVIWSQTDVAEPVWRQAVLAICDTPAGSVLAIRTA